MLTNRFTFVERTVGTTPAGRPAAVRPEGMPAVDTTS